MQNRVFDMKFPSQRLAWKLMYNGNCPSTLPVNQYNEKLGRGVWANTISSQPEKEEFQEPPVMRLNAIIIE